MTGFDWIKDWVEEATAPVVVGGAAKFRDRYLQIEVNPSVIAWPLQAETDRRQVAFPIDVSKGKEGQAAALQEAKDYIVSRGLEPGVYQYGVYSEGGLKEANIFFPAVSITQHIDSLLNVDTSSWKSTTPLTMLLHRRNRLGESGYEQDKVWLAILDSIVKAEGLEYGKLVWAKIHRNDDPYFVPFDRDETSPEAQLALQYNKQSYRVADDGQVYPTDYWVISEVYKTKDHALAAMENAGVTVLGANGSSGGSSPSGGGEDYGWVRDGWEFASELNDKDLAVVVEGLVTSMLEADDIENPIKRVQILKTISSESLEIPVGTLTRIYEEIVKDDS